MWNFLTFEIIFLLMIQIFYQKLINFSNEIILQKVRFVWPVSNNAKVQSIPNLHPWPIFTAPTIWTLGWVLRGELNWGGSYCSVLMSSSCCCFQLSFNLQNLPCLIACIALYGFARILKGLALDLWMYTRTSLYV